MSSADCQFFASFFVWPLQSYSEGLCFLASHSGLWKGPWLSFRHFSVRLARALFLDSVSRDAGGMVLEEGFALERSICGPGLSTVLGT